jgi:pimeloyl-ACP methyl ester carboxylesterase
VKVVFLHAYPLDERMWEPQLEALRDYEIVAPRLYGRGRTVDEYASSVLAEADGELIVVGASLGGYTALAMAHREPARVKALALVGARVDADSPDRRAGRADTKALIESADQPAVARAQEQSLARSHDELIEALEAIRDRDDHSATLAGFQGPVFVAVGEGDLIYPPEEAQRQANTAQHARFRAFAGARHLPSLEQPDEFNAALAGFLADV